MAYKHAATISGRMFSAMRESIQEMIYDQPDDQTAAPVWNLATGCVCSPSLTL